MFRIKVLFRKKKKKWVINIFGYDLKSSTKKGKKIVVADALSREDENVEALFYAISIIQPDWIMEESDEWKKDK